MTTRPPPHDDFRAPQPRTARSEARTQQLLPQIDKAETDDAAMTALLIDADELDARVVGRAFGERVSSHCRERNFSAAARLLERLSSVAAGSRVRAALVGGLVVGMRPAALTFDAATTADDGQLPEVGEVLDALLDEMVSPAVIGASVVENRERRRLILLRLEVRGEAAAHGAAAALATAPPEPAALDLLGVLERAGSFAGLDAALGHPAPRVRQEALKALLRLDSPEGGRTRALAALDSSDAALRRIAIDHVVAQRIAQALPWLRRAADSPDFDELEYAEKKRILVGLAGLGGTGVRDHLLRLLRQRNLLRRAQIEESRIAAACALAVLRDGEVRGEIESLRDRTGPPHRIELDQALLNYQRSTAPPEIAQQEARARLGSQSPGSTPRSPIPRTRPVAEPQPVGDVHKATTKPQAVEATLSADPHRSPTRKTRTAATPPPPPEEGFRPIDLDTEPPLLPTSIVSVPHAQGSKVAATRARTRPPETAPTVGPAEVAPEEPPPQNAQELPADVVDLASAHRKDE